MGIRLFAYRSYRDVPAALTWLAALGFSEAARSQRPDGTVEHAEVRFGELVVMVGSFDADYQTAPLVGRSTDGGLYLLVDDVDDIFQRAVTAGATTVFGPEVTEWGSTRGTRAGSRGMGMELRKLRAGSVVELTPQGGNGAHAQRVPITSTAGPVSRRRSSRR